GTFGAALGVASFNAAPEDLGDAVFLGETALIRDPASGLLLIERAPVVTPWMFGTAPRSRPAMRFRVQSTLGGITLREVLHEAARPFEEPLILVGLGDFSNVSGVESHDAPAGGRSIKDAVLRPVTMTDQPVLFVAAVLRDVGSLTGKNKKIFHIEKGTETVVDEIAQVHALVLESKAGLRADNPGEAAARAKSLLRLQPDSVMTSGEIVVYRVAKFEAK
ncbi:hypothetical protein HZA57_07600, partial [Candidatus Poribacteria bacterium]|nr:hypothetical protein [Candidatus Poribacteria bacterium]